MGPVSIIVQLCESALSVIIAGFMTFAPKIFIVTVPVLQELHVTSRNSFLQEL